MSREKFIFLLLQILVVSQNKKLPWIKLQNLLNTWPHEVTRQIKYVVYLLPKVSHRQSRKGRYLLGDIFAYEAGESFKHMVFWDYVINENHFISTNTMFKAVKYGIVETLCENLPIIKASDHLNKWFCEIAW